MLRTGAVGATCALMGAGAGIAGSAASTTSSKKSLRPRVAERAFFAGRGLMLKAGPLGAAGPPVHSDTVVPNEKGGFDTVTMDRGSFSSMSGSDLTIAEGTKSATYKTVTFTIPGGATIRRNDASASLSDLKSGDTVVVLQGPGGTVVYANDAQHENSVRVEKVGPGQMPVPGKGPGGQLPVPGKGPGGQLPAPLNGPEVQQEGIVQGGEGSSGATTTSAG
jgi:hypothetical protein